MKSSSRYIAALTGGSAFLLMPRPALAMHISEGILPLPWAALWYVVAIGFVALGLREIRIRSEQNPQYKSFLGLVGAAVFVISCLPIPVPITGTSSHPAGTGLAAILIGPGPTVVITLIALALQALFLAHGGLSTLGANTFSMGVLGAFAGYGVFLLARKLGASRLVCAFLAGIIADWATYIGTSFALSSALHGGTSFLGMFVAIIIAFIPTQLFLGILEGFVTSGAYSFILTRRPGLLMSFTQGECK